MTSQERKYLPGIDLLKFILAILIVSAHCSLFVEYNLLHKWWGHLTAIAVPIFLGISSYLFFRKEYAAPENSDTRPLLIRTLKRLAILFACWYILVSPMTYSLFFSVATLKETIFAIFLSCTTRGYWFIKALFINTAILYFCRKTEALIACSIIAFSVYLYCSYNYVFHYNSFLITLHPYYSFYYNTAFFCIGALFARFQDKICFESWHQGVLLLVWLILFLLLETTPYLKPLFLLLSIIILFPVFYQQNYSYSPNTYKTLRDMSIILYMVQFLLIWIYDGACSIWLSNYSHTFDLFQNSLVRFSFVISACIFIAWIILHLEKKSHFCYLRYLH